MRGLLILGLLLSRNAFAVTTPTSLTRLDQVRQIQERLVTAKRLQDQINALNGEISELSLKVDPNIGRIESDRLEIKMLADRQLVIYNQAIHLAIRAYDLTPPRTSGTLVRGFVGVTANWIPVFGNTADERTAADRYGNPVTMTPRENDFAGLTWPDGAITISRDAFRSPGYLAAIILHETVHFGQRVTPGRGDIMTRAEMELDAYNTQLKNRDVLGLTDDEFKAIERSKEKSLRNPDGGLFVIIPLQPSGQGPEPTKVKGDEAFSDGVGIGTAIRENPADTTEPEPPSSQASPVVATPAQLAPPPTSAIAIPASPYRWENVEALRRISERTCTTPQSLVAVDFDALRWFPDIDPSGSERIGASLSGCVRTVFDRMVEARVRGQGLNAAIVKSYVPAPAPLPAPRRRRDDDDRTSDDGCSYYQGIRFCPPGKH